MLINWQIWELTYEDAIDVRRGCPDHLEWRVQDVLERQAAHEGWHWNQNRQRILICIAFLATEEKECIAQVVV